VAIEIGEQASAICGRRATWRAEHLNGFLSRWPKLDTECLTIEVCRDRKSLHIADLRLMVGTFGRDAWDGRAEPSVSIVRTTFNLTPGAVNRRSVLLVSVGMHAMARRLQRGFQVSDEALFADFADLGTAAPGLLTQGVRQIRHPAPGTRWRLVAWFGAGGAEIELAADADSCGAILPRRRLILAVSPATHAGHLAAMRPH
jgi:hypothetical protein